MRARTFRDSRERLVPLQHRVGQHKHRECDGAGGAFDGAGTKLTDYTVTPLAAGQWSQATQPFKNVAGADGDGSWVRQNHGAVGVGGVRLCLGDRQHHQRPDDRDDAAVATDLTAVPSRYRLGGSWRQSFERTGRGCRGVACWRPDLRRLLRAQPSARALSFSSGLEGEGFSSGFRFLVRRLDLVRPSFRPS